ncbi:MAG: dihydroorotase [Planctomycetota bacterium]
MRTLITGADVVLPTGIERTDVLIDHSSIAHIGRVDGSGYDERVDASGLVLIPGAIDDQVHFREPGLTHKEDIAHGSRACAAGGITTYLEMPNTVPHATTQAGIDQKLEIASRTSAVNYGFYIGATPTNLADLKAASRTPGIKIFIGSSTGDLLVDEQEALEAIFAETTLPACAHCEDEAIRRANELRVRAEAEAAGRPLDVADHSRIRDERCALESTRRAVNLAARYRHRFHVLHVSTGMEAEFLRDRPAWVTAEACPHHLLFNVEDYPRLGSRIQMNPSIKAPEDNAALWQALRDGVIEVIATDHAPHTLEEKALAYPDSPSGLPAVENSLALMLDSIHQGRCTLEQVVRWMCEKPAEVWSIERKGRIAEGFDADLVLVDLGLEREIRDEHQLAKSGWSPWHGVTLRGWPVRTWVLGREVMRDGVVADDARGGEAAFAHTPA